MNLRIGDHDRPEARAKIASVRPGTEVGRTRTALSDIRPASPASSSDQGVVVRLSPDAQKLLARRERGNDAPAAGTTPKASADDAGAGTAAPAGRTAPAGAAGGPDSPDQAGDESTGQTAGAAPAGEKPLTAEQKDLVTKLAARDTAVRAHEAAHQAAAAGLGGGASFTYETGPDGKRYAVGGEVPVSLRSGRTPQETISNAQTVRSAALAPADPSAQDLAVAAQASQMEAEARQEIAQSQSHGGSGGGSDGGAGKPVAGVKEQRGATGAVGAAAGGPATAVGPKPATSPGAVPATPQAASGPAQPNPQVQEAVREQDQLAVFSTLKSERSGTTINGHLHSSGGTCVFCARAAARYA